MRRKLILTFALSLIIYCIILNFLFSITLDSFIQQNRFNRLMKDSREIGQLYFNLLDQHISSDEFARNIIERDNLAVINSRILIYNEYRQIILDTKQKAPLQNNMILTRDIEKCFNDSKQTCSTFINDTNRVEYYYYTVPFIRQGQVKGAIVYHGTYQGYAPAANMIIVLIWATAFLFCGALSLLYIVLSKKIVNPLLDMNKTTRQIAAGDFSVRVPANSTDELKELSDSINYMASQLEDTEDARRRFLENVSHELRSPITVIRSMLQVIIEKKVSSDKQVYYTEMILNEVLRMSQLINDLMDLTHIQSSDFKLEYERVDIAELLRRSIAKFESIFTEKKIVMRITFDEYFAAYIRGDELRLVQIFDNLIKNAASYTPETGDILVESSEDGKWVSVTISNSGEGISPEDLPYIFERFYKANKARNSEGVGLGLAITKQLIILHGGTIEVESTNGVSCFKVAFPAEI
ncbi:hypothetical protein A7K50_10025 [Dehalobacter sp. MCB1]|uniref:sensor histidine kinase n=2 Tax=unclassified Dehalobacter TaxID=2635733 RepID=UPI000E6C794D|nr:HAMP domain-containing sensor histidine kinase [Dehalobacter sp. 12DCB1]RJE48659.1 hypothetical protein A7K50_10025 [Dehalobacter sp. MCB1]TCX53425.1 hypothetical protein C1I36_01330 [Dehalobacter sp. 14DCB1]TCX54440.1 hypothetical protein C1I38_06715 [Dehalobacter sp. 12DCB1]